VAPLQTSLFMQRTIFAYEHWDRISPVGAQERDLSVGDRMAPPAQPAALYRSWPTASVKPVGRVGMALKISVLRMQ
jgi:hypothetical protein